MTFSAPTAIPETPPADLLAELDAAARALDMLRRRAAELASRWTIRRRNS